MPRRPGNKALAWMVAGLLAASVLIWLGTRTQPPAPGRSDAGAGPAEAPPTGGRISGLVRDPQLDALVADARVGLDCADGVERQVLTGPDGVFAFERTPAGQCTLSARAEGYRAGGRSQQASQEVGVENDRTLDDVELELYRDSRVSGRVLAGSRPVEGAELSVLYLEAPGEQGAFNLEPAIRSQASGAFQIEGLGPGRVHLLAEADGYALAESDEVFLKSGSEISGLDLQLSAEATLVGLVRDPQGAPIPGAEVRLLAGGLHQARQARCGPDGRFVFEKLTPGAFQISARAPGYLSSRLETAALRAGERTEREIVLEPVAGIGGQVVDQQGQAVVGAAIYAQQDEAANEPSVPVGRSDGQGRFWLAGPFRTSTLGLWASHPRHGPSPVVHTDPASAQPVLLRLSAAGGLTGRVLVVGSGQPVTRFEVRLSRDPSVETDPRQVAGFARRMFREADGRFRLDQLAPGAYALEILAPGYGSARRTGLVVDPGRICAAGDVHLETGGSLTGRVVDARTGQAVAAAVVRPENLGGGFARAMTDGQGAFRLEGIPTDRLSIQISARRYVTRLVSGVQVPAGGQLDLGTLRLEPVAEGKAGAMNYAGVGAVLRMEDDGSLRIDRLLDGAPAAGAGLAVGTRILRVDGMEVSELGMRRAIELIRGEVGSAVSLEVLLPGSHHPQVIEVGRDQVVSR